MKEFEVGQKLMIVPAFMKLLKDKWKWPEYALDKIATFDHVVISELRDLGPIVIMPDGTYVGGISWLMARKMEIPE